jgi:hypothetical protein
MAEELSSGGLSRGAPGLLHNGNHTQRKDADNYIDTSAGRSNPLSRQARNSTSSSALAPCFLRVES